MKKYKIGYEERLNDKLVSRISTKEKNFIIENLDKLNNQSKVEIDLSTFIRISSVSMAESIALGRFTIKVNIPERTLTFKLKKK